MYSLFNFVHSQPGMCFLGNNELVAVIIISKVYENDPTRSTILVKRILKTDNFKSKKTYKKKKKKKRQILEEKKTDKAYKTNHYITTKLKQSSPREI